MSAFAALVWLLTIGSVREASVSRVDLEHGFYLISRPAQLDADALPPLVICLHGTETTAADIHAFWRSFEHELPMVFVAPQAIHAGWRDTNLSLMNEFLEHLSQTVRYDPDRVLLAGHSAGGAMAFHLLYVEAFPATAVAVSANYVPPTVKPEHVRARNDVPIFYAVGEADINRDRMRKGLALLRGNDASVTVRRPRIGHVLDHAVGQAAMRWFEDLCRAEVERVFADARHVIKEDRPPGRVACAVEQIIRRQSTHFADQVSTAMQVLEELQRPGRQAFVRADQLLHEGRPLQARKEVLWVEQRYRSSSLAQEAKRRRLEIEARPHVTELLELNDPTGQREETKGLMKSRQHAPADKSGGSAKTRDPHR